MLKAAPRKNFPVRPGRYALIASQFNSEYVDSMIRAALDVLHTAKAQKVKVVRVPGSFEIPVVAASLAQDGRVSYSAILCLGVILRGETTHAQHIAESVSLVLAQLQTRHLVPIINGVYLFENHAQARTRCLNPKYNRGIELARTALAMTQVMREMGGD
jgi:6,7-dimethyl-8-ribityllumazine synthase